MRRARVHAASASARFNLNNNPRNVRQVAHGNLYLAIGEILESAEKSLLKGSAEEEAERRMLNDVRMDLGLDIADLQSDSLRTLPSSLLRRSLPPFQ